MKKVTRTPFSYRGAHNRPAAGDVYVEEESAAVRPAAVLCHGFKGFKDWGFFPAFAEQLARRGLLVCTFNFSHNGCDLAGREEADLEAFRANCLAYEEEDLKRVLAALRAGELPHAALADGSVIHLAGHSRGGSAVIRCGGEKGVVSLVLLASIAKPPAVSPAEAEKWRAEGCGWTENARTKTRLPLGLALLDELENKRSLLAERLSRLAIPVCIIHGDEDTSVPVSAAEELKHFAPNAELHILRGANHTFGAKHPYAGTTPDLDRVMEIAADFISR